MITTDTKRIVKFTDQTKSLVTIKLEITHKNGYPEFTASGDYKNGCGQIVDNIKPKNEAQKELIRIWHQYHLNGMNAGTKTQATILEGCKSKDYADRCEYLDSFKITGEPLTRIDFAVIKLDREEATEEFNSFKKLLQDIADFETEFKNADGNKWHLSKSNVLKILFSDVKGDFRKNRFWKNSKYSTIQNPEKRQIESYKKELQTKLESVTERYKKALLSTALYDLHPKTKEPFKYGSVWITENLPDNLWEDVLKLCETIEEAEHEEHQDSPLVVDINEIPEDSELLQAIEEAQEDENCGALALHLGLTVEELKNITSKKKYGFGNCYYEAQGINYYCGTEEEMKKAVSEYIEQSVWAFNPDFLANQTGIPKEAFKFLCEQCENGNDGVLAFINITCGLDAFIEASISEDGIGHFLNSWDGTQDKVSYNGVEYIICKS